MRVVCLLVLAGVSAGCGGGGGAGAGYQELVIAPTAGVVRYQGQPVANATVTFYPDSGPAGVGMANEQGEFQVKTNGALGAPVGECKITVSDGSGNSSGEPPPMDGNEGELLKKTSIPKKYADKETTDLIVQIPPEGNPSLQLDLTD